jgi:hypothetical protein
VPRHVARLVAQLITRLVAQLITRLVAQLVTRLVIDYFASAARPGASARRDSSRDSSSTTSPTSRVRLLRHVARLRLA